MLVVTRKTGDVVVIDPGNLNIRVMLVAIQGDEVRIGIEAPKDIDILREELRCSCESNVIDPYCRVHGG